MTGGETPPGAVPRTGGHARAAVVVAASLAADLVTAALDPRTAYADDILPGRITP